MITASNDPFGAAIDQFEPGNRDAFFNRAYDCMLLLTEAHPTLDSLKASKLNLFLDNVDRAVQAVWL